MVQLSAQIASLSPERSEEMHHALREVLGQEISYIDIKIEPNLSAASCENRKDAFVWEVLWDLEAVTASGKTILKSDISEEGQSKLAVYFKELGWHLVQATKQDMPCPWAPGTFNLHCYEGHPSWEYVDGHPNAQGYS